ncbi:MAG: enoyl-CoA hydratase/isomerase family protein [Synergistaceae bacterium]|nr:enoyl-CoA hydratase/isomerase family protein [Synergistaceae bacterium]
MSETSSILCRVEEGVGYVTLHRPQAMNTFNTALALELDEALSALDADEAVRVVVIEASGRHFSTGIDLKEVLGKERHEMRPFLALMDRHNHRLAAMGKPVIASVQGYVLANGAGLALACDFIVASDDAVLGTTAVNVGLICLEPGYQLSRWIGPKRALQYVLSGDFLPAAKAEEMGILYRVVPREELAQATAELAARLAAKSPLSLRTGKRGMHQIETMVLDRAIDVAGEHFAALAVTEDAREGLEAFLAKRPPAWKGR